MSAQKLHNIRISPLEDGGIKDARDAENNIIISDSMLHNILSHQINKRTARYKVVCVCKY